MTIVVVQSIFSTRGKLTIVDSLETITATIIMESNRDHKPQWIDLTLSDDEDSCARKDVCKCLFEILMLPQRKLIYPRELVSLNYNIARRIINSLSWENKRTKDENNNSPVTMTRQLALNYLDEALHVMLDDCENQNNFQLYAIAKRQWQIKRHNCQLMQQLISKIQNVQSKGTNTVASSSTAPAQATAGDCIRQQLAMSRQRGRSRRIAKREVRTKANNRNQSAKKINHVAANKVPISIKDYSFKNNKLRFVVNWLNTETQETIVTRAVTPVYILENRFLLEQYFSYLKENKRLRKLNSFIRRVPILKPLLDDINASIDVPSIGVIS